MKLSVHEGIIININAQNHNIFKGFEASIILDSTRLNPRGYKMAIGGSSISSIFNLIPMSLHKY